HHPRRRRKPALLDQALIAGLGNIYVDESCFAARVKPDRLIKRLTDREIKELHRAIRRILKLAIKKGGTSTRNYVRSDGSRGGFVPYLQVYGRVGQPCKNCRAKIIKIKLAGRGTHFCPQCQK
ncbi:MAG: zinc finger domain-containing protein, partial [archaeon]